MHDAATTTERTTGELALAVLRSDLDPVERLMLGTLVARLEDGTSVVEVSQRDLAAELRMGRDKIRRVSSSLARQRLVVPMGAGRWEVDGDAIEALLDDEADTEPVDLHRSSGPTQVHAVDLDRSSGPVQVQSVDPHRSSGPAQVHSGAQVDLHRSSGPTQVHQPAASCARSSYQQSPPKGGSCILPPYPPKGEAAAAAAPSAAAEAGPGWPTMPAADPELERRCSELCEQLRDHKPRRRLRERPTLTLSEESAVAALVRQHGYEAVKAAVDRAPGELTNLRGWLREALKGGPRPGPAHRRPVGGGIEEAYVEARAARPAATTTTAATEEDQDEFQF